MSLARCYECDEVVSSRAEQCPKCGAPFRRKSSGCGCGSVAAGCAAIIIVLFGLLVFGQYLRQREELEAEQQPPALTITADRLMREYEANEVAADRRYKGKVIVVTGVIDSIGTDVLDTLYVVLQAESEGLSRVQCYFGDSHATELSQLREGVRIDIKGRCGGKFMNIQLRGCTIYL